jgi:hypothetical protein
VNNYLLETGKNYACFLKINFLSNIMQVKFAGFGILSLFLIMLVPVYAEVTELSIEKKFYTIDEGIVFVGIEDEGNKMINVIMADPNGKESYLVGGMSNSEGKFETMPKNVNDFFSTIGTYQFTAFTIQKDNGITVNLEFDGNKISESIKYVLQLNGIQNKIVEVERTITFTVSITDDLFIDRYDGRDPVYSLENAPVDATIDGKTGKFIWTPSKSYGNYEDVIYNFDIIVKADNQEDRENISITVKKAYDEPVIQPKVEPVIQPKVEPVIQPTKSTVASFVDATKDPQSYVNRYNDESAYKEWFDENYSQYSSIYEAVGLEEPEFGICGEGTKLINGVCTIIQKMIEKPWWQFW